MTIADKITSLRLILAPLFFIVYLLPVLFPAGFMNGSQWTVPVLWLLFFVSEITDLIDGKIARKRQEVSDFGKLYDPFADVLVRITYFLCFVVTGILPAVLFLAVLYREFGILFLRILMMKKGVAMGARKGGKLKAVTYMAAGVVALLAVSAERLEMPGGVFAFFRNSALVVFIISVIISVISFADYLLLYKKTPLL
ncbi:MAG: CDP-diacylglycerol--glycerol-3-phosphate 3-phosphatidyltransferase [Treponema sp.]|jgi:CDP-diacylglycerol--glycerol-3-phosphate 3-phosphatidyltransferase|nr:CDP-diacylglycerol--glycerol-3-phosphate 3-phosphatidyltransferase [Treponema sp.]